MLFKLQRILSLPIIQFFFYFLFLVKPPLVFAQDEWKDCVSPEGVPTLKCLEVVFSRLLFIASGLIVLALFIMFIIGSLRYLTSRGNPESLKKAQGTLMWALIGTLLFVGSYLILNIIDILFLGGQGKLFKFEIPEF